MLVPLPEMARSRLDGFLGHDVSEEGGLAESLVRTQESGAGDEIAGDGRVLTAAESVAQEAADTGGADRADGPDAPVADGGVHRVAAAGGDVQRTDAVGADVLLGAEVADGALDVLGSLDGVLQEMGFAFTRALVGGLEGEGDEAVLGQSPGVEPGGLLLHPTPRVDDHDRGQRVSGAGVGHVQVTGRRQAVADEGDIRPHRFTRLLRLQHGNTEYR
ncbi:hypothetical protein IQ62_05490 [Streptomyces scabiei]|nr:hypothetical protein IQ62_05490 [Streptomyces scabiei]